MRVVAVYNRDKMLMATCSFSNEEVYTTWCEYWRRMGYYWEVVYKR